VATIYISVDQVAANRTWPCHHGRGTCQTSWYS